MVKIPPLRTDYLNESIPDGSQLSTINATELVHANTFLLAHELHVPRLFAQQLDQTNNKELSFGTTNYSQRPVMRKTFHAMTSS